MPQVIAGIYASPAPAIKTVERFTGFSGTGITLGKAPLLNPNITTIPSPVLVFKNGSLLDPAGGAGGFTLAGAVITLGTAAVGGDVFVVEYWAQGY